MYFETLKQTHHLVPCFDLKNQQIRNLDLEPQQDNSGKRCYMIRELLSKCCQAKPAKGLYTILNLKKHKAWLKDPLLIVNNENLLTTKRSISSTSLMTSYLILIRPKTTPLSMRSSPILALKKSSFSQRDNNHQDIHTILEMRNLSLNKLLNTLQANDCRTVYLKAREIISKFMWHLTNTILRKTTLQSSDKVSILSLEKMKDFMNLICFKKITIKLLRLILQLEIR